MEIPKGLESRLQELVAELNRTPGAANEFVRRLQGATVPVTETTRLTGLVLSVAGQGSVDVVDTDGSTRVLAAGKDLVLQPRALRPEGAVQARVGEPAAMLARPSVAGVVLVRVRPRAKRSANVAVDPSGVYRSWAQWGPMQLIARVIDNGTAQIGFVPAEGGKWSLAAGSELEIAGMGYLPRLRIPESFAAASRHRA